MNSADSNISDFRAETSLNHNIFHSSRTSDPCSNLWYYFKSVKKAFFWSSHLSWHCSIKYASYALNIIGMACSFLFNEVTNFCQWSKPSYVPFKILLISTAESVFLFEHFHHACDPVANLLSMLDCNEKLAQRDKLRSASRGISLCSVSLCTLYRLSFFMTLWVPFVRVLLFILLFQWWI